jgi:hypothetical protein
LFGREWGPYNWGMRIATPRRILAVSFLVCASGAWAGGRSVADDGEALMQADGRRVNGRLVGDAKTGFRFAPQNGRPAIGLEAGSVVAFPVVEAASTAGPASFQVVMGGGQRLAGRLTEVTAKRIRFTDGPGGKPFTLARAGALAVIQRPGEAQVFFDSFDSLDDRRWTATGDPAIEDDGRTAGNKVLRLPAHGASVTTRLAAPISAGRFEVAIQDGEESAPGTRQFVDLAFRTPSRELAEVRVVLGWAEDTLSVESPQGPGLAVQRLTRKKGWRRLTIHFGPDRLDLQLDDEVLAHGNGPPGPLAEIRLATEVLRKGNPPASLSARFDDLQLVRIASPPGRLDPEPSQDEARMITGDQTFGWVVKADAKSVVLEQESKEIRFPWSEVAGIYFRRVPETGAFVEGMLVRAECRAAGSGRVRELDVLEGALVAVTDSEISIATPYAGVIALPRERMVRMEWLGHSRRLMLDPYSHHLGDRIVTDLDPPQPEGGAYELPFDLRQVPEAPAHLVIDVVQVVGESGDENSDRIKNGELLTRVYLNGKSFDTLNHHVRNKNEAPERIRIPIPRGHLVAGRNLIRFEQIGTKENPAKRDNLGLLGIALEFESARPAGTVRP